MTTSVYLFFTAYTKQPNARSQGGFGLERSEQKAHEYFMLAAEQGEVRGLAAKGRALLYGIQVCCGGMKAWVQEEDFCCLPCLCPV
jgi:TPR repeat protein